MVIDCNSKNLTCWKNNLNQTTQTIAVDLDMLCQ
jgi:hypothetical protein